MKKYQKPIARVIKIEVSNQLLSSSSISQYTDETEETGYAESRENNSLWDSAPKTGSSSWNMWVLAIIFSLFTTNALADGTVTTPSGATWTYGTNYGTAQSEPPGGRTVWFYYNDYINLNSFPLASMNDINNKDGEGFRYDENLAGDTIARLYNGHSRKYRLAVQSIIYSINVPAYTKLTASYGLTAEVTNSEKTIYYYGIELFDWGKENKLTSVISNFDTDNGSDFYTLKGTADEGYNKAHRRGYSASSLGRIITCDKYSPSWTFDNSTGSTSITGNEYLAMHVFARSTTSFGASTSVDGHVTYSDESLLYTYFSTVSFNGNGATSGSMSTQTIVGSANLAQNTFTRSGYIFKGWSTSSTATTAEYSDTAIFAARNGALNEGRGPVTLYAVWTPIFGKMTDGINLQQLETVNPTDADIIVAKTDLGASDNALVYIDKGTYTGTQPNVVVKSGDTYTCTDLVVKDKSSLSIPVAFTAATTTYTRDFGTSTSKWGTICQPYSLQSDENIQYYTLTGTRTSSTTNYFIFTTIDEVAPNTPAIYKLTTGGSLTISKTDEQISATPDEDPTSPQFSDWALIGTYQKQVLPSAFVNDKYYFASDRFWQFSQSIPGTVTILPFRAYFQTTTPSDARQIYLMQETDGTTTEITAIPCDSNTEPNTTSDTPSYTLQGQRTPSTTKGLLILHGKKIIRN